MSVRAVLVAVLLVLGCAAVLLSCVAVLRLPRLAGQLHALAPAGTIGVPLVCVAVAVDEGAGRSAGKVLIVALVLALTGPVVATATARAAAQSTDPPPGLEPPAGTGLHRWATGASSDDSGRER